MTGDLILYGDPHGNWAPLLQACAEDPPAAVAILGDMEADRPLRRILAPLREAGIPCRYILGNHDLTDGTAADRVLASMPEENLGGRVEELAGLRVAGLGGVYKGRLWYPRDDNPVTPRFHTRDEYMAATPNVNRFRGGLPLHMRDVIFPEDHTVLATKWCDILISHEAPSSHDLGFEPIDALARDMGARLVVHGHHHRHYEGRTQHGIRAVGLAIAQVFRIRAEELTRA